MCNFLAFQKWQKRKIQTFKKLRVAFNLQVLWQCRGVRRDQRHLVFLDQLLHIRLKDRDTQLLLVAEKGNKSKR